MSEEPASEPAATPKPGGGRKKILIIGLPLLLLALGGGGAAAYVMGIVPAAHDDAAAAHESPAAEDPASIVFVDLPDLLINLNADGSRLRFLKIAAALEVHGVEEAEAVRRFVPRILDSFHMYLRAIRPEELQGSEGVYRIKEELLVRANDAVRPAQVRSVLVRELLMQ